MEIKTNQDQIVITMNPEEMEKRLPMNIVVSLIAGMFAGVAIIFGLFMGAKLLFGL